MKGLNTIAIMVLCWAGTSFAADSKGPTIVIHGHSEEAHRQSRGKRGKTAYE
jgi:hypothetical protein